VWVCVTEETSCDFDKHIEDVFQEQRRNRLEFSSVVGAFSLVVRQMPGYNSQRWGTARNSQIFSVYCYICSVLRILCTVCVSMRTVLLPPGVNAIAVKNK
jgi:hypothetical protein